jgi:hypothetical protein
MLTTEHTDATEFLEGRDLGALGDLGGCREDSPHAIAAKDVATPAASAAWIEYRLAPPTISSAGSNTPGQNGGRTGA